MKIKNKNYLFFLGAILIVLLTGCSKNPQQEFIDMATNSNERQEQMTMDLSMEIKDIQLGDAAAKNPMTNMIMTQLKEMKIKGTYSVDTTKDLKYEMNMKANMFGTEMPLNILGDEKNYYLSTNFLNSFVDFAAELGADIPVSSKEELKKYEGKYFFADLKKEMANEPVVMDKDLMKSFNLAYQKELVSYLKGMDKKSFEKKDDTITRKFSSKEIKDILNLMHKVAKSDKKYKEVEKLFQENNLNEISKMMSKMTVTVSVNPKDKSSSVTMKLKMDEEIKSLTMVVKGKVKEFKKISKFPSKNQIIDIDSLNMADTVQDSTDDEMPSVPNDEQFQQLLAQLENNKKSFTEQDLEEMKQLESLLTKEQYKQVEALIKDALKDK